MSNDKKETLGFFRRLLKGRTSNKDSAVPDVSKGAAVDRESSEQSSKIEDSGSSASRDSQSTGTDAGEAKKSGTSSLRERLRKINFQAIRDLFPKTPSSRRGSDARLSRTSVDATDTFSGDAERLSQVESSVPKQEQQRPAAPTKSPRELSTAEDPFAGFSMEFPSNEISDVVTPAPVQPGGDASSEAGKDKKSTVRARPLPEVPPKTDEILESSEIDNNQFFEVVVSTAKEANKESGEYVSSPQARVEVDKSNKEDESVDINELPPQEPTLLAPKRASAASESTQKSTEVASSAAQQQPEIEKKKPSTVPLAEVQARLRREGKTRPEPLGPKLREQIGKRNEAASESIQKTTEFASSVAQQQPEIEKKKPSTVPLAEIQARLRREGKTRPPLLSEKLKEQSRKKEIAAESNNSVLHIAVYNDNVDEINRMLSGVKIPLAEGLVKMDPNVKNGSGKTPLHFAVSRGNLAAVKALLDGGADTSVKDNSNENPIDLLLRLESERADFNGDIKSPILDELLKERTAAQKETPPERKANKNNIPERFRKKTTEDSEKVQPIKADTNSSRHRRS